MALLSSPSSRFGRVLSALSPTATKRRRSGWDREQPSGTDSWSLSFHALLEGILRDAEDVAVVIPYQRIRWRLGRFRIYLDRVTVPRLVVLSNTHESGTMMGRPGYEARLQSWTNMPSNQRSSRNSDDELEGDRQNKHNSVSKPILVSVTGLRDRGNCIFGDPLMVTVVGEGASSDFIRGFSGRSSAGQDCKEGDKDESTYGGIVECPKHAHLRLLLYRCYHEIVAVVAEFYRLRKDSTAREFKARKRLNAVLADLDAIEDNPKGSCSQPSGNMIPTEERRVESGGGEKIKEAM